MTYLGVLRERQEAGQALTSGPIQKFPKRVPCFSLRNLELSRGEWPLFFAYPTVWVVFASILRQKQKLKDRGLESNEQRQRRGEEAGQGPREAPRLFLR